MKQKKGHLFIDEKEKQIVQDIFVTYIQMKSIRKTTDYIKEKYDIKNPRLKNMSSKKVYAILTNKTYIGIRVINTADKENREEVPAVWEPIIDRETFGKVQKLLQRNSTPGEISGTCTTFPVCCGVGNAERNCRGKARILQTKTGIITTPIQAPVHREEST